MIYAETQRLYLRALEKSDFEQLIKLIDDWDVAKWLTMVPHPYSMKDAEEWYERVTAAAANGTPEFFVMANKNDKQLLGAVGLHISRVPEPKANELEIGYWLGKPFWGQGLMSEAVAAVIDFGFQRKDLTLIASTTDPENKASQNVLRKAGFTYKGIYPRIFEALRGPDKITRWELEKAACMKAKQ